MGGGTDNGTSCASVAALRDALKAAAEQAGVLLCHDNISVPSFHASGAARYDRQGSLSCREAHEFEAGR